MRNNYRMRLVSLALSIMMLGSVIAPAVTASADESVPVIDSVTEQVKGSYNDYISDKDNFTKAESNIELNADKAILDSDIVLKDDVNGKTAIVWKEGSGKAEWTFSVQTDAY